jgi:hypothetical protein
MSKYVKVFASVADKDGIAEIPEGAQVASVFYHPVTGELVVALIQPIALPEAHVDEPVDASEDKSAEKLEKAKKEPPDGK